MTAAVLDTQEFEMSMDKRIETKHRPMYGCHTDLDKYRKTAAPLCNQKEERHIDRNDKACLECKRSGQ